MTIEVRSASKHFGEGEHRVTALDAVSLTIRDNEFFTLLGPSGCGKTTLLRLIAGFELPSAGALYLDGEPLGDKPAYRRPVNTVFQSYALFPHMTVAQNIAFGLEMLGRDKAEIARTTGRMLEMVRMAGMEHRRSAQLSGGQQQRVALARALATHPRVLLLDEPLSALDLKLRKEMQIELKRLQLETGLTFVFVTHDQEEALTMSDRVAVMSAGRIRQIGTPAEIYEHPTERFVADFIGETNFLPAEVIAQADGRARVRLDSGVERAASLPPGSSPAQRVTVAVRPERVALCEAANGAALSGRVETVVYFGTDTIYHLRVERAGDAPFKVRVQNRSQTRPGIAVGDRLGVEIPDGALQVLRD